jgi:hypothetical protein
MELLLLSSLLHAIWLLEAVVGCKNVVGAEKKIMANLRRMENKMQSYYERLYLLNFGIYELSLPDVRLCFDESITENL